MTLLLLLALWFTVSLPVAAITGRALAFGRPRQGFVSHQVRAAHASISAGSHSRETTSVKGAGNPGVGTSWWTR
jgi:hypothetical protein